MVPGRLLGCAGCSGSARGEVRGRRRRRVGAPAGLDHDHGGDGGHDEPDRDQRRQDRMAGAEAGRRGARRWTRQTPSIGPLDGRRRWRWCSCCSSCSCSCSCACWTAPDATAPSWDFDMVFSLIGPARRQGARARRLEREAAEASRADDGCGAGLPAGGPPRGAARRQAAPGRPVRARRTEAGGRGGRALPAGSATTCPRRRRMRAAAAASAPGPATTATSAMPGEGAAGAGLPLPQVASRQFTGPDSGAPPACTTWVAERLGGGRTPCGTKPPTTRQR